MKMNEQTERNLVFLGRQNKKKKNNNNLGGGGGGFLHFFLLLQYIFILACGCCFTSHTNPRSQEIKKKLQIKTQPRKQKRLFLPPPPPQGGGWILNSHCCLKSEFKVNYAHVEMKNCDYHEEFVFIYIYLNPGVVIWDSLEVGKRGILWGKAPRRLEGKRIEEEAGRGALEGVPVGVLHPTSPSLSLSQTVSFSSSNQYIY